MILNNYTFEPALYKMRKIIKIIFPYNSKLIKDLKNEIPSASWSQTMKCWYVVNNQFFRDKFQLEYSKTENSNAYAAIHAINRAAFLKMHEELKLKGYSSNTIKTYLGEFAVFLKILGNNHVDLLNSEKVRSYMLYCINHLKISENLIHSRMNAIKFYFEKVLKKEGFMLQIPRPKKPSTLPKVISTQKLKSIFEKTENAKHQLILKIGYGMGLRVSEIVNLKIENIDSDRMQVLIKCGKGKKDRYVQLPETMLEDLRNYYKTFKPKEYLFEGQYGGKYSTRSAQAVFKQALERAKVKNKVGIHGLRHSYATHLLELGTDITYIQKLLGHQSIKTTSIYTHVTNKDMLKIKSPLDSL